MPNLFEKDFSMFRERFPSVEPSILMESIQSKSVQEREGTRFHPRHAQNSFTSPPLSEKISSGSCWLPFQGPASLRSGRGSTLSFSSMSSAFVIPIHLSTLPSHTLYNSFSQQRSPCTSSLISHQRPFCSPAWSVDAGALLPMITRFGNDCVPSKGGIGGIPLHGHVSNPPPLNLRNTTQTTKGWATRRYN